MTTNNNDATVAPIVTIESLSNNAKRNVFALKLTEYSFSESLKMKGIDKAKNETSFNVFRKEYNGASNLVQSLVATGMDGGRGKAVINYATPERHKARLTGGVKEDSALFRAMEFIREERTAAFFRSRKERLLPEEVELTDAQWITICLAMKMVPLKYRVETRNGNLTNNKDTCAAYLRDFCAEILNERIHGAAILKEAEEAMKDAGAPEKTEDEKKLEEATARKEKAEAKAKLRGEREREAAEKEGQAMKEHASTFYEQQERRKKQDAANAKRREKRAEKKKEK